MTLTPHRPLAALRPLPGASISVQCRLCGQPFEAETTLFPGDRHSPFKTLHPTVCDECAALEGQARTAMQQDAVTPHERRQLAWLRLVGTRYADFRPADLPEAIRPHIPRVLRWTPQPRGIGLLGPSRTGKSPLLYALAQQLHLAGHDVYPTSGIEFQRQVHRMSDDRHGWARYLARCENADILLIDDADKLNLTPGVEAEYYGLLEHRRNWQRPLLATLNLGPQAIAALAPDRRDRITAILERLRDLCEILVV